MDRWERCLCDFEGALPARLQFRMQQPVSADWHNEAKKINLFKGGRQELARRVAEAEIDLRRIRYSRHRFLSAALSDGPPEHVLDKLPVMGNLRRPNAPEMRALVKDVTSTAQALEKIGTILWREGNRLLRQPCSDERLRFKHSMQPACCFACKKEINNRKLISRQTKPKCAMISKTAVLAGERTPKT
jgi:hypothetical protein